MSQPKQHEEAIFAAAQSLPANLRKSYLDTTCGNDSDLRQRIESRLAAASPSPPSSAPPPTDDDETLDTTIISNATLARLPEEAPGDVIGRYALIERIGEGGFGVVYMAEQQEPVKRRVALKITKLGMDTKQVVARFEAERQALALMDHPNIAGVIDGGATGTGRPFFVMELVRGVKITDYCDQHKVPLRQRLELFIQVCQAIEHAHQKGIVHRDIKPSNILVTLHDKKPVCKVIDFGIAKATQGTLTDKTVFTQADQFIGTPAYMSPEQAELNGLEVDARSDIYSLGVLLYELLTGHTPFEAKGLLARGFDEMRRIIREIEPLRPSNRLDRQTGAELKSTASFQGTDAPRLISLIRGDLDWVVMKCLEKDRARRYETAAKLAADIQSFLANQPVQARPPSQLYRLQKLVMRNRLAFGAGTVFFASLIVGLCLLTMMVIREKDALDLAENSRKSAVSARETSDAARLAAEKARAQSEVERKNAEAALQQSESDRVAAQGAEQKALVAQKEAESARKEAETALQQAETEREKAATSDQKAKTSQSLAETSRQLAEAAETKAATEAGKSQEAAKTAAVEATLRQEAESARQRAEAAEQAVRAESVTLKGSISNLNGSISNFIGRLAALPPSEALKLSAVLFTTNDETQPWAAQFLRQRGEWRMRQADLTNAIQDFSKALDLDPDHLDTYGALAPLLVQQGDTNAYDRLCARWLAHVDRTNDPPIAPPLAMVCFLAPWSGGSAAAATLAPSPIAPDTNAPAAPDRQIALGLAEYRRGHYAEALNWAGQAADNSAATPASRALARAAQAMSQQQLNQTDEARATLATGEQLLADKLPALEGGDPGPDWREWFAARDLLREAAVLIPKPTSVK